MIYVFKDGSGFQKFPEPNAQSKPFLEISGTDEQKIITGSRYRMINSGEAIEFLTQAEIEAEDAETALTAERASMVVSRFQARAALLNAGLLSAAEAAISNSDAFTQLAWADAQEFRRNSPTVAALAPVLNLNDKQLDDLFRQAATIEA